MPLFQCLLALVWLTLVPGLFAQGKNAQSSAPSTELPDNLTEQLDIVYAAYGGREMHLDLFSPKEKVSSEKRPAIVVVHGGGWLKGDKSKFRALAIALASRGYVTAAIEYRLGGEALFPAGIHDCNAAVRFLRANADKYGIDPERIGAVGGSAGGHLVGLMAVSDKMDALQGEGGNPGVSSRVKSTVVMAGPLDLTSGSVLEKSRNDPENSNANHWFGKTYDEAPDLYKLASPFHQVSAETGPMLFICGDMDSPERNEATREKLRTLGVKTDLIVVKNAKHGCWNRLPWFTGIVADIDTWFQETL